VRIPVRRQRHQYLRTHTPSALTALTPRTPDEIVALLTAELRLTMAYLKVHPKVYWIWTHRKWCLEHVPRGPGETESWRTEAWKMELMVVEKILDSDARNCEYK
jgi:hypothetical protein